MAEIPEVARVIGHIPSGLFILTVGRGESATGLLTSFVQQAGFDPLTLTVAVKRDRNIVALIRRERAFCLSILHEGSRHLMAHFARGFDDDTSVFRGLSTRLCGLGIPYLADSHGHMVCELVGESTWSDHVLFCGQVVEGACHDDGEPWVHLRKNGMSY